MTDPHQIRDLIKGHLDELEAFGEVSVRRTETGPKGGRPGTAFYLNRQQALLVCILSKTEKAKAVLQHGPPTTFGA
ncbi:hypothetical protein [Methylobacterium gossipiicola]|uniref:Uncharacterized protein n=1 Tax=Methylobacterium gossipiicola TaxID=582675 RepID=A0A1I2TE14_9HYPH|nr:hypothetical protein [Methylobacterium gossipiicola]SFG63193.1 hypothetical protein SAMN05192565_10720 [Methylobacterium gossipiicola]